MPNIRIVQTTFQGGELDPSMGARTDVKGYFQGGRKVRNFYPLLQGGLMRRPGTEYCATLSNNARLIPFIFSNDQRYILAFGNQRLDVFDSSGSLLSSITTSCPWVTAQLNVMNYAQYGDTLFLVHRDFQPQVITRTSATDFSRSDFSYEGTTPLRQPYYNFAAPNTTITPSATTGDITLTTSADHWTSAYGSAGIIARVGKKEVLLTTYVSATVMNGTVRETLAGTGAVTDWDEQTFSVIQGYPGSVTLHDNRLWFGGTTTRPQGLLASKVGGYFNFNVDDASADDSIDLTIAGDQINEIKHLLSGRHLQVFTDDAEFYVPSGATTPITPDNVVIRKQTPYGSSDVAPKVFDGATIFMQRNGKSAREFLFQDLEQAYSGSSLSTRASHLLTSPLDMSVLYGNETRPEQIAFIVNNDGTIAYFHSDRSEKIGGWGLWTTDGNFKSLAVVGENMFATVERTLETAFVSLAGSDFIPANNKVTKTGHGISTGQDTRLLFSGTYPTSTTADGSTYNWSKDTTVYVYSIDANNFNFHTTYDGAIVNNSATLISFSDTGVGAARVVDPTSPATSTVYYLEKFGNEDDIPLDCSKVITSGSAATTWTGLSHLEGAYVHVNSGNHSLGEHIVANNQVDISEGNITSVRVGLNYTPEAETMPVDTQLQDGPLTGEPRRIIRCVVDLSDSLSLVVNGKDLITRKVTDDLSLPPSAITDRKEFYLSGYSRTPTITLTQNDPLPLRVLGIMMEVAF